MYLSYCICRNFCPLKLICYNLFPSKLALSQLWPIKTRRICHNEGHLNSFAINCANQNSRCHNYGPQKLTVFVIIITHQNSPHLSYLSPIQIPCHNHQPSKLTLSYLPIKTHLIRYNYHLIKLTLSSYLPIQTHFSHQIYHSIKLTLFTHQNSPYSS